MAAGGVAPMGGRAGQTTMLRSRLGGLEERFAFQRAVSRLAEMRTDKFLELRSHQSPVTL